jgi:ureidoglycolate lyase
MKLLRVGPAGAEKPAMLDAEGKLRDLSGVVPDIAGEVLSDAGLARLRALDPRSLPLVSGEVRIGPPIARPLNFVCIGLNYADHAAESNMPIPKEPIIFLKSLSAFQGPYDDVRIPRGSAKTDWEVELGVVIGRPLYRATAEEAAAAIAGYTVVNDVSMRDWQRRTLQWLQGKAFERSTPAGPYLVTPDEVGHAADLEVRCEVDGQVMQQSRTSDLLFKPAEIAAYFSQVITLQPGDLIATGTPGGVGDARKPPVYLQPGQVLRTWIEGLGECLNHCVPDKA